MVAKYRTLDGIILTEEDRESMLDIVDEYGVVKYCEWNGVLIAVYFTTIQAFTRGDDAVRELRKRCPNHNWMALG